MDSFKTLVKILIILSLLFIPWQLHWESFSYWIILSIWLISTWIFRFPIGKSLVLGFAMYVLAALLKLVGNLDMEEYIFRLSLLITLLAVAQSLYNLKYNEN